MSNLTDAQNRELARLIHDDGKFFVWSVLIVAVWIAFLWFWFFD